MRFNLSRHNASQELLELISKEIKRKKIRIPCASSQQLKELAAICRTIEKEGIPSYLVCKKLKGALGKAIFLHPEAHPLRKGQVIAPYSGEAFLAPQNGEGDSDYAFSPLWDILLSREEQRRFDGKRPYHPRRLYSLDVDAERRGNFTRFINHSDRPNVEARFLKIPPNSYGLSPSPLDIIYLVKKAIYPGEQLLVCYEGDDKSYWSALNIKPFPLEPKTFQLNASLQVVEQNGL